MILNAIGVSLKFYISFLSFNNNKATYKEFFGCPGIGLCSVWWFLLWVLDLFYLKGYIFLSLNPFLTIASVLDAPRKGVQVLFGH
jgi:hypothetical protein